MYVGSSAGGNNIYDSGSLGTSTSTTVSGLPTDGSQVYVTLWYYTSGSWLSVDAQYTAYSGGTGTPAITSPAPGSTLTGSSVTFSWSANGTSLSEWWMYVGSSVGANNIYDSGSLGTSTSKTVSGLPTNGSTVYVRLYYKVGSSWPYVDAQYTAYDPGGGDDYPDSCSNAADLWPDCVFDSAEGVYRCTIQGSIGTAGDVDWFKLEPWSSGAMVAWTTGSTD
jgi:hypothetical protein